MVSSAVERHAATYFVLGKANDENFAKAEHLAETLMSSLPSVTCHILPTLPDAWPALCKTTCARLGCSEAHPLVWTGTGTFVGSLGSFEKECVDKYDIHLDRSITQSAWTKIAKENLAHAQTAAAGQAATTYPTGEGRGAAVTDALLAGHARFLAGAPGSIPPSESVKPAR